MDDIYNTIIVIQRPHRLGVSYSLPVSTRGHGLYLLQSTIFLLSLDIRGALRQVQGQVSIYISSPGRAGIRMSRALGRLMGLFVCFWISMSDEARKWKWKIGITIQCLRDRNIQCCNGFLQLSNPSMPHLSFCESVLEVLTWIASQPWSSTLVTS